MPPIIVQYAEPGAAYVAKYRDTIEEFVRLKVDGQVWVMHRKGGDTTGWPRQEVFDQVTLKYVSHYADLCDLTEEFIDRRGPHAQPLPHTPNGRGPILPYLSLEVSSAAMRIDFPSKA